MFKKALICLDNSDCSTAACEAAVKIASAFGNSMKTTGCHVYAARLHDARFRTMEPSLPPQYQTEAELSRQRKIHESLITKGLQVISDSYLAIFYAKTAAAGINAAGISREGTHYEEILKEISEGGYDLVVMGGYGLGMTVTGRLGSVCGRVTRRASADCLIIKETSPAFAADSVIAAAIDGSPESFAALQGAMRLAKAFNCRVHAVAAYDHQYHVRAFRSLSGVLSEEAGRLFRFKEQERLHEEVIDKGLAKVYKDHLDDAVAMGATECVDVTPVLLAGKPIDEIIGYVNSARVSLLCLGRRGIHANGPQGLGATAEDCLREAPCNVLLSTGRHIPPVRVDKGFTPRWNEDALRMLERIPAFARGVARKLLEDKALEAGQGEITPEFMREARRAMTGDNDE